MSEESLVAGIDWLGHASFRIRDRITLYFDPWELKGRQPPADLVLITHAHHDHLSPGDVKKIAGPDTDVVAPPDCEAALKEAVPGVRFHAISPGQSLTLKGVGIEAVPAYNVNKKFHPKGNRWVGYRVALEGRTIYHTGDTDDTPEARAVKADVVLVPIGGTYTLDAPEAAAMVAAMAPGVAIPMHWGKIVGSAEDAQVFGKKAGVPVRILEPVR